MKVQLTEAVRHAVTRGAPVVALESTIIAHGMPYPQNLEMAREVEEVVRGGGAVPATIAIVDGVLRAGLSDAELAHFAETGPSIMKVSTRDIPYVVARRQTGATTVASTMRIAALAGIRVFATGGIGGAHREAGESFDISNDLNEFAVSDVAVVTAGAKAILDLPLTLEILETNGVPVVGFGTGEFPAFYSRQSGLAAPMRLDTADEVAAMMKAKWSLGLKGGVVVANPISPADEIPASEITPHINRALAEAKEQGVAGKQVTPFLLKRITEITEGRSLKANIALVMNNARVAAAIAVAYARR
ncbi:MAG: pseudouridine-5'-phosphate glycosidase [Rhizobiales bacterium]|nr:pseudouridine-5'-phosphate glycosidase [Hyphomicrobiales bacterium]